MKFFQIVPSDTNFDFIGKFKYFIAFSVVTLLIVVWGLTHHGLNFGIDFTGGTVVQLKYKTPTESEAVRKLVSDLGDKEATVQAIGTEGNEFLVTVRSLNEDPNQKPLDKRLVEKVGADNVQILSSDIVGPKVGEELKWAALQSLFYSVILITIYIWLRFDARFAPGATIAMVHDLFMVTGFYIFTGREFTITAIAALLTIAGYSVNDTIVVYDRVREMNKHGGDSLALGGTINKAINITLSRTLLTSGVTLISVLPLVFFCKGEIQSFALAMVFGIFVGTYSTVYIASPFTIYVDRFLAKKEGGSKQKSKPATA